MTDSTSSKLLGTWYLTGQSNTDGTMTFHRTTTAPMGWGSRIEIHENGDIVDAYSAKCGNDEKLHNDKGQWTLDLRTMNFRTTIPIDYKGTDYKIQKLDTTELILTEIKK